MTEPLSPAPIWRRLAAATYDGLLLLALWMVALLIDTVIRDLAAIPRSLPLLRAYLFLVGLGFFGWFWTHGGQTLGMRVWRLRLQRANGSLPGWSGAALHYSGMLVAWGVVLTPAVMHLPQLSQNPNAPLISGLTLAAAAAGLLSMRLDPRRRAPHDRLIRAEVVLLPKS